MTKTLSELSKIFAGLSNEGISQQIKYGTLSVSIAALGESTISVCAFFLPWHNRPVYYACKYFYANAAFVSVCGNRKLTDQYNQKNKHQIKQFTTLKELEKFSTQQ